MAFPSYVNAGTRQSQGFGSSITPALPASLVTGNLLIAVVVGFVAGGSRTYSWPAGWTEIDSHASAGANASCAYYIVDGAEAAPAITWSGGNTSADARVFQFTGNLPDGDWLGNIQKDFSDTAVTAWSTTSINTLNDDSHVITIYAGGGFNSTINQPPGLATDQVGGYNEATIAIFSEDIASGGTPSTDVSAETKPNAAYAAFTIEIRSEAAAVITPGTISFNTPGADDWIVEPYHTLVVEWWGAGASGDSFTPGGVPVHGSAGGDTEISTLTLEAGGGQPGSGATLRASLPGTAAVSTGGDINMPGGQADRGNSISGGASLPTYSAKGGDAPYGGAGGATPTGTGKIAGNNGTAPGAGGSPAVSIDFALALDGWRALFGAGGNSGAYGKKTYVFGVTAGAPAFASTVNFTIGAGGAVANGDPVDSGAGANGRVTFTWYDAAGAPVDPDPLDNDGVATGEITGTVQAKKQLTAIFDDNDPDGYASDLTYQWTRAGVDISGATGQTYTPSQADVGSVLRVEISYTDGEGFRETITIGPTAAVLPPEMPLDYFVGGEIFAAYGLRLLRTDYTGPLFKLRHGDIPNATLDVSAGADGEVDWAAVETWRDANGNNGALKVSKWYNQYPSGENKDLDGLAQTVTNAPDIALDSADYYRLPNGEIAIRFDGNEEFVCNSIFGPAIALAFLAVVQRDDGYPGDIFRWYYAGNQNTAEAGFKVSVTAEQDWQANAAAFVGNGLAAGRTPRAIANISEPTDNTDAVIWDGELSTVRVGIRRNGVTQPLFINSHSGYTQPPDEITGSGALVVGPRPFLSGKNSLMAELVIFGKDVRQSLGQYRGDAGDRFVYEDIGVTGTEDLNLDISDDEGLDFVPVIDMIYSLPITDEDGLDLTLTLVAAYVLRILDEDGLDLDIEITAVERPPAAQLLVLSIST